jgi:hypothetical protein
LIYRRSSAFIGLLQKIRPVNEKPRRSGVFLL